jgi:hypothetical protein
MRHGFDRTGSHADLRRNKPSRKSSLCMWKGRKRGTYRQYKGSYGHETMKLDYDSILHLPICLVVNTKLMIDSPGDGNIIVGRRLLIQVLTYGEPVIRQTGKSALHELCPGLERSDGMHVSTNVTGVTQKNHGPEEMSTQRVAYTPGQDDEIQKLRSSCLPFAATCDPLV